MSRVKHTHQGKSVAQLEIDKLKKQVAQLTNDNKHLTGRLADALNNLDLMNPNVDKWGLPHVNSQLRSYHGLEKD